MKRYACTFTIEHTHSKKLWKKSQPAVVIHNEMPATVID